LFFLFSAIRLDNCTVKGFFAHTLIDGFAAEMGYSEKFGLYHVDFNDPNRKRTVKDSATYYRKLIASNGFYKDIDITVTQFPQVSNKRDTKRVGLVQSGFHHLNEN
jgi:hypothetical protein